jgi:enamine deaminase RidA (YjgF/YER057c/UK114 family)
MTDVRRVQPPDLVDSRPSGFTQVICARGENLIFVSGQVAIDQAGRLVGRGDIGAQTHQVLKNIDVALQAASASLEDVVKLTIYVVDYMIFPRVSGHRVKGHTMIWNEVLDDEEAKRVW